MPFRVIYCCFLLLFAQSAVSQTFKHHHIGESAQNFFSVATMSENKGNTGQYCRDYLNDAEVNKAYQKAVKNPTDTRAVIKSADVTGCWDVLDALEGKDITVGARYAAEIGTGSVTFHAGKLITMAFTLPADTPFEDVIADIKDELAAEPLVSAETLQNGFGATVQQQKATWQTPKLIVIATEMKTFVYGITGISVVVTDKEYLTQTQRAREANRPNTIR